MTGESGQETANTTRSATNSESDSILDFQGVGKTFGVVGASVKALENATISIRPGEFVSLLGPSGCGKSTLLNLAAGLIAPTSGAVNYRGAAVKGPNTEVGYVTQKDNLLPWRKLAGNVRLGLEVRKVPADKRDEIVSSFIERVGLSGFEDSYPHELSGGMRQRANIIRTLCYDPEVVLMDEPFGPLDALTRGLLQEQLLALWSEFRKTVLFVTHDIVEAIALSDRIVVMSPRPGRVTRLIDVDIPRPRDVFRIHTMPGYDDVYNEVWEIVMGDLKGGSTK